MVERIVFCIFPKRISYIETFHYKSNLKSKWFSILVEKSDTFLIGKHYFLIDSYTTVTDRLQIDNLYNMRK